MPLPAIAREQSFSDTFKEERFLRMLPLLHFLRTLSSRSTYRPPPLRATFIVDDPNLHWPRYGYVDYNEIAQHARKESYHVSFATIPLDGWLVNRATTGIFRQNIEWLSLLIHGNNHLKHELARCYGPSSRQALLLQAINRVELIEKKTKLRVCRVMVPPHGACSAEMLRDLPRFGFESACISAGSLRHHNSERTWARTLGYFPCEVLESCPVLPRSALTGNVENKVLLAAYLGQPMIIRAHHVDFRDGVERFDHIARKINALGPVIWSNMTGLSRLNYVWRLDGSTCRVRPLGSIVEYRAPRDAMAIVLEATESGQQEWRIAFGDGLERTVACGEPFQVPSSGDGIAIVRATGEPCMNSPTPLGSIHSLTAISRRLLTEARDRLQPYWYRQ
jgi:hypothetical protein